MCIDEVIVCFESIFMYFLTLLISLIVGYLTVLNISLTCVVYLGV